MSRRERSGLGAILRLIVAAVLTAFATVGCSSATDSGTHPPPNDSPTHPAGSIDLRVPASGGVVGIAITKSGTMVIARYDSNDVVFGDVSTLAVTGELPIGLHPGDVALSPDGSTAYVTNYGTPTVAIIDVASRQQTGVLTVTEAPSRVLVSPDGSRVWVTNSGSGADTTALLFVFDAHTRALIDTVTVARFANGLAYDSARAKLYVSSVDYGKIFEIDANVDTVTRVLQVGGILQQMVVIPDRSELWVADEYGGVRIFDLPSGDEVGVVPTTSYASRLAATPDWTQLYETAVGDTTVSIIDVNSHRKVKTLFTGGAPQQMAFNSTGSRAVLTEPFSGLIAVK